jgi:hypothetical protein
MTQNPGLTIRSEAEQSAVFHLRNALLWRVKVQLQTVPAVTAEQYREMVDVAMRDAHALATEISNLYAALDALQKVGWRAPDAFDRVVPPMPGASPNAPQTAQPNRVASDIDNLGRDLDKGFKDLGGAIDGLFSGKKK